jgi:hypothetical protein
MGVIVKVHTFVANTTANASEVNRNFDDLFNLQNGNIDSANIATTFSLAASQVTINDTAANFSSTTVEGALGEVKGIVQAQTIVEFSEGLIGNVGDVSQNYAGHIWQHTAGAGINEANTDFTSVLAYYQFVSGNLTADSVSIFTLSAQGGANAPSATNGIMGAGNGVAFDGANGYYLQSTLLDTVPTSLAIDFWMKSDAIDASSSILFQKVNVVSQDFISLLIDATGTLLYATEQNNAGVDTIQANTLFSTGTNTWTYVCVNWDTANGKRLWVNGVLEAQNADETTLMAAGSAEAFAIGASSTGNALFQGAMSMFRVRNKALTQKDVDIAYASEFTSPSAVSGLSYDMSMFVECSGVSALTRPQDWSDIEVLRNANLVYKAGGLITGLTATDRIKLLARSS